MLSRRISLRISFRRIFTCRASRTDSLQELLQTADRDDRHDTRCSLYARAIRQCGAESSLQDGKRVHQHILDVGLGQERLLMNLLVEMYGKCGCLEQALDVFRSISSPNAFSWTIMIVAYAQNGHLLHALRMFKRMDLEGIKPTLVTCASIVAVCASLGNLADGRAMHVRIIESGFSINSVVENSLVNLYGKCGCLDEARAVFDEMFHRDVIAWTSFISSHVQHGKYKEAVWNFHRMEQEGVKPNDITFSSVLEACSCLNDLNEGRKAHAQILEWGVRMDVANGAELILMYGRCNCVQEAEKVFESLETEADLVVYNSMISVYSQVGYSTKAVELFHRMKSQHIPPDEGTYIRVLSALTDVESFSQGKAIHEELVFSAIPQGVVLQTAVIKMYLNGGCFEEALDLFECMRERDMFSWTVMITACTERGYGKEALDLFHRSRLEGLEFNKVVLISAVDACATVGALREGRQVHEMVHQLGYDIDAVLGSVLVNLYGKCGSLVRAREVFSEVALKDAICWNAMLASYAHHGHHREAVDLFRLAILEAVELTDISFQCVLFACSHVGKLREGWEHFVSMVGDHQIAPTDEHFRCMVDLLGRTGHLEDAEELINVMPVEPAEVAWTMLLGACRVHRDRVRGDRILEQVLRRGGRVEQCIMEATSPYVLVSNIYSDPLRYNEL